MYKYLLLMLALATSVQIKANNYIEGVDYEKVENISVNKTINKPFIIEYFWFGCSHCQNLEPHINNFSFENEVKLIKKPAPLKERWVMDARLYYALSETGNMSVYDELFNLYTQKTKQGTLPKPDDIIKFFKSKNIDLETINNAMQSDSVTTKVKNNLTEMVLNKITGVPKLVVNGRYLVHTSDKIKSYKDYMDLIKFLLTKD